MNKNVGPGTIVLMFGLLLALWLLAEEARLLPPDPFSPMDAALMQVGR